MIGEKKINCLIVDDEPLAANLLKRHIEQFSQLHLVASCNNAIEAFGVLQKETIELLFLDIQMPGLDGLKFARSLQHPPNIIFTTAYRDYAVESYELNVVDYLLKPITVERFFKSITKYLARTENQEPLLVSQDAANSKEDFIYVNTNRKFVKIWFREVLYIESLKDYIGIHLPEQRILTKGRISEFEYKLPTHFLRIHRSYIVNIHKITAFTKQDIEIAKKEIPIGASYKRVVTNFLQRNDK